MKYTIEKYKPEYKNEILNIWEQSVLETHHFLSKEDFIEIKEMLQNFDFSLLQVFCLVSDSKSIGFVALHNFKIEMLFLAPEFIGKGLGLKMLKFATTTLGAHLIDVNEQNIKATRFYKKFGFETFERVEKDDLGKDYPILRMKLTHS